MPTDHTSSKGPAHGPMRPIEEGLEALQAAAPPKSTGRIRTLAEARSALAIPTSSAPDALRQWGIPADFWVQAYPVKDDDHPDRLVEFAILRVVTRTGGRLTPRARGQRLHIREKSQALWVVYGALALSAHNGLVIEALSIDPAFDRQFADKNDEIARGITTELLRLLSPPEIINRVTERLQWQGHALDRATEHGAPPMSQAQRALLDKLAGATHPRTPITDEQLIAVAQRYIVLGLYGVRHPLPVIAEELGISREQARDRVRKARKKQYLAAGEKGRATATIGPKLKKTGWQPPLPQPTSSRPPLPNQTTRANPKPDR